MEKPLFFSIRNPLGRLGVWARKAGLTNKLAVALIIGVTASSMVTYWLFTQSAPYEPKPTSIYVLLVINLVLSLILGAVVARLLVQLLAARRSGIAGSKLHGRMVFLFSLIAITPTILMAIFTLIFFEVGLQSWFSEKVRTVVDNATSVAEAYIEEHQKVIKADILGMANDLDADALLLSQNRALLERALNLHVRLLSLSEAIIFDGQGRPIVRASSDFTLGGGDPFPREALERAQVGRPLILASQDDDRVRALVKLNRFFDSYLYISRYVDPRALALVYQTRTATTEYERVANNLADYKILFTITYIGVALLILITAVLVGLWFANLLAKPISNLVEAAEKVRRGDLSARVPPRLAYDELGTLSRAFNRMTGQLKAQRDKLVDTNRQLDERRRFTEAVLAGVSSGVLGLNPEGEVTLPNRAASSLLMVEEEELAGRNILEVWPEIEPLLSRLREGRELAAQSHITLNRNERERKLLVRMASEVKDGRIEGYVITFDDITEQVAAQRMAAWADVARRIAHEIKNPLTPIQLSAERLRRKYLSQIRSDTEVFRQCTDTIIRQVGDLRAIVDEFSAFARMPTPSFGREDVIELARRAVFLQDVANPKVKFTLDAPEGPVILNCDGRLVSQALTNLLKNAVESLAPLGEADENFVGEVTVIVSQDRAETIVRIIDNGQGLPEKMKDRLTEPYVTTRLKGTGLGLAIVKKIMEEHGGALVLQNRPSGGAEVTLVFNHAILEEKVAQRRKDASDDPYSAQGSVVTGEEKESRAAHGT